MYASIRHAFAAFCSQQVADLTTELGSLRNQLCSLRKSRDEGRRECQHASARLAVAERAHRRLPPASLPRKRNSRSPNLRIAPRPSNCGRSKPVRQARRPRLERLRGEVRQSQHELDMANKQLELACKENELLAKIDQGDLARCSANWRSKNAARPTPSWPRR